MPTPAIFFGSMIVDWEMSENGLKAVLRETPFPIQGTGTEHGVVVAVVVGGIFGVEEGREEEEVLVVRLINVVLHRTEED